MIEFQLILPYKNMSKMLEKSVMDSLRMLVHFIFLFATLNLATRAAQPVLPGNSISGQQATIELKSIALLPFSSDTQDVRTAPLITLLDKANILASLSFASDPKILLSPQYNRFKPIYHSALLSSILHKVCILRL